ncbi:hypothetical protein [uncultured Jatrophihabitans sp.]|uniref:hypothetical protein n=1 Tax=uncultured Jatrophihabitans sp. TaxID=1610747 RepID=UPI0035C9B540
MTNLSVSLSTDTVEGRIAQATRPAPDGRLDPSEVNELAERAALAGMKPTALARNLIRIGLAGNRGAELADAVDRLDAVVQELRGVLR